MASDDDLEAAAEYFQQGLRAQMAGDFESAVASYRRSIAARPTAEAHTFLGWTYSFQGRLDDAIEECHKAIAVDPTFGNPYNDIGAYLIEMGRPDEALPWLERATQATRYEAPHFPHFNMGRVYLAKEMYARALQAFQKALEVQPGYPPAQAAVEAIRRKLN